MNILPHMILSHMFDLQIDMCLSEVWIRMQCEHVHAIAYLFGMSLL